MLNRACWIGCFLCLWSTLAAYGNQFKIGSLLPEQLKFDAAGGGFGSSRVAGTTNGRNITDAADFVNNAIGFATHKLSEFFYDNYGCKIALDSADTKCEISHGTRSYFELAKDNHEMLVLFGGSCETTIKPIAESVPFFNLTLLSFTETDPTFSDQSKYYGFYRMVPSEEQHNHLRIHLIRQFNWTRIGTIYLTKAKYTLAHNLLIRELDKQKIAETTVSRSILENQTPSQLAALLKEFQANDIKIMIGIFDVPTTVKLFCEIYKMNMYGENYQWIILGTYSREILADLAGKRVQVNCTIQQILTALNGTMQTRVAQYSYEYERKMKLHTASGQLDKRTTAQRRQHGVAAANKSHLLSAKIHEITEAYVEYIKRAGSLLLLEKPAVDNRRLPSVDSYFHGYAFDVILTIFQLLGNLIESKNFTCANRNFERDIKWFSAVIEAFNNLNFRGLTGQVTFKNGSRNGQLKLEQLRTTLANRTSSRPDVDDEVLLLNEVVIYVYDQNLNSFYSVNDIVWHGNTPPPDKTVTRINKIPKGMFIGMSILATSGIALGFGFLIFNIKFRKHRYIKMSSPYLNNLIIIGCLLSYTSIFFLGEYEGFLNKRIENHLCEIRVWLLAIGFTLAFGAMFSKTYRVHAILTNSKLTRKVIKDYKLFGIVIFLLVIDMVILLSWQFFDPLRLVAEPYELIYVEKQTILEQNLVCKSTHITIWIASLFGFKSLLILFGCFFAYETRHVTISALNDSKYIGMSVYNVLIMCSTGAAIAFIVHTKNAAIILITLFIFACTSITLCLVFLPKIFEVKQDPVGKKKQKSKSTFKKSSSFKDSQSKSSNELDIDRKITNIISENINKKSTLNQLNAKLKTLLSKINELNSSLLYECQAIIYEKDYNEIMDYISELKKTNPAPTVGDSVAQAVEAAPKPEEPEALVENKDSEMAAEAVTITTCYAEESRLLAKNEDHAMTQPVELQENQGHLRVSKRKFNPPPKIVDLNLCAKMPDPGAYSFKLDI